MDLSRRYRVNGVPKTVVNGRGEILGALPEDQFVERGAGRRVARVAAVGRVSRFCVNPHIRPRWHRTIGEQQSCCWPLLRRNRLTRRI